MKLKKFMPIKIPAQNKWYQSNRGDIFGSIWSSFNIDLTQQRDRQKGNLRTTRMLLGATSATLTDLGVPVAFKQFGEATYAVAGAELYVQGSAHTSTWSKVTGTGTPPTNLSQDSDMEIFLNKLWISEGSDDDVHNYNGTAWGTQATGLAAGANTPHMMCVYADRLYCSGQVSNDSVIYSMNTSEVVATSGTNTMTILDNSKNCITFLRPVSDGIWVGTVNTRGGKGTVYKWDGSTINTPDATYHLQSAGALAGIVKDDVLYIVDADGRLMYFNGGTFVELDRFPIKENYLTYSLGTENLRWIHPNGMTVADDRILMLIDNNYWIGALKDTIPENVPSGIWEWSKDTGLYHKFSLSHCPVSGAGGGSITDYGQNRFGVSTTPSVPGACAFIKQNLTPASDNGTLFAGAKLSITAATNNLIYGIWIDDLNDTVQKYGYIVTPKIYASGIEDSFQKFYIRHRKLINSTDKIIVKYRNTEVDPDEATITWVDTDTFTVTATAVPDLAVGDEVEVIQGDGSGKCAHISSFTGTTTLTVNLDDTFTGVTTRTAKARFQKWIKCGEGADQTVKWHQFPIGINDTWVQLKICMQWTGENELDDILLISKTNKAE